LRELGRFEKVQEEDIIFHKDLRDVEYVVADVGGKLAAPVYGMFQVQDLLQQERYQTPDGVALDTYWLGAPPNDSTSAVEWAGEWTVTYETFRDMGAAFMVALVLIYVLVVWEFGNFRIPALIMAPIPLTLLGIIPAHFLFFKAGWGGEFTATSMIGWIALAGIIVRNSILLVDFSIHEIQHGSSVVEAVIQACKTRTRPILITALALVAGSSVIFFDPIFQGMAISLASGVLVSTVLTLIVIPLGCIKASKDLIEVAAATALPGAEIAMLEDSTTAQQPKQSRPSEAARTSLWMSVWSKLFGVISMFFYLVRGIFLLLIQLFKKKPETVPVAPKSSTVPSDSGSSGAGGGSQGGVNEQPVSVPPVSKVSQVASAETSSDVMVEKATSQATAQPPVAQKGSPSVPTKATETEVKQEESNHEIADIGGDAREALEVRNPTQVASVTAEDQHASVPLKPKKRPSTLKKAPAAQEVSASVDTARNVEHNDAKAKQNPTAAEVDNMAAIPMKKKAGRRGIRLKT
jgi:hypothetical protein